MTQKTPPLEAAFPTGLKTTCMHPICTVPDRYIHPSTYRASIEVRPKPDATSQPLAPMVKIEKLNEEGINAKYLKHFGKALNDEAWWFHLSCLEELLQERRGFLHNSQSSTLDPTTTVFGLSRFFIAEFRGKTRGSDASDYDLPSTHSQALEKWKAEVRYVEWTEENLLSKVLTSMDGKVRVRSVP